MTATLDQYPFRTAGHLPTPSEPADLHFRLRFLADLLLAVPPPGDAAAPARLLWRDDTGAVQSVDITRSFLIGRGPGCDIRFASRRASGRHCRIWMDETRHCWIEDLGSTNGTAVNGTPLTGPRTLAGGDLVEVGGVGLAVDVADVRGSDAAKKCSAWAEK
jgi:hypothetical protein